MPKRVRPSWRSPKHFLTPLLKKQLGIYLCWGVSNLSCCGKLAGSNCEEGGIFAHRVTQVLEYFIYGTSFKKVATNCEKEACQKTV